MRPSSGTPISTFQKEVPIALPNLENIAKLRVGIIRTSWNDTLVSSLSSQCEQVKFKNLAFLFFFILLLFFLISFFIYFYLFFVWMLSCYQADTGLQALLASGVSPNNIVSEIYDVPGAFELPFAAQRLAASGTVDAIVFQILQGIRRSSSLTVLDMLWCSHKRRDNAF